MLWRRTTLTAMELEAWAACDLGEEACLNNPKFRERRFADVSLDNRTAMLPAGDMINGRDGSVIRNLGPSFKGMSKSARNGRARDMHKAMVCTVRAFFRVDDVLQDDKKVC